MPLRNVPFGAGVNTTPSLPTNKLAVASSAILPTRSRTAQLPKPRAFASISARVVRIEASGLGVDRHAFHARLAVGRQRDGKALGRAHGRLVQREAPAGRLRIRRDQQRAAALGP